MDNIVQEFKSVYKEKGPHDLQSQVKYLSALADHYYKDGKANSSWVSLLKAHTLYNSVAARDKDNEILWSLRAFDVQSTYWKCRDLKADLLYSKQREITNSLRSQLVDIRKKTKAKVKDIKSVCDQFDRQPDPSQLSSPENIQSHKQFIEMVQKTSVYCTQGVIKFFGHIIDTAVEVIGQPPCQHCVTALGSLARGEATPYSDLEFLFLIGEWSGDNERYFETLAVTVYFLIDNLQETKLKYMAIKELNGWFEDACTNGLKIDGLQELAGNIPTGNGTTKQHNHFICTVDQMVSRYREVYSKPDPKESLRGDISAMLSSTVYIHGDTNLLVSFQREIQSIEPTAEREHASTGMLLNDTQSYNFFPDWTLSLTRNLKRDIYRYPSMLILNLRIIHRFFSFLPLDAVDELVQQNILSASIGDCLKFSFCCALYMRLSAYLHLHSQNENMSVLKSNAEISLKRYQWFVDRPLFLHMMIQLIPLKTAISNGKLQGAIELNSQHIQMCGALVSYHCLDYKFCYDMLCGDTGCAHALLFVRAALHCAYFDEALTRCTEYLEEISRQRDWEKVPDTIKCYSLIARIKWAKGNYSEAQNYFNKCIELQKNVNGDSNHHHLAICYSHMGNLHLEQGQYDQAARCYNLSLEIHQCGQDDADPSETVRCYSNLGKLYFEQGKYEQAKLYHLKALDMSKRIYFGCDHPDIAQSYYHLGDLHRNHGLYNEALINYIKSLEMRKRVFGNLDHPEIARCYLDLGNLHSDQGQFDPARLCYAKALDMLRSIYRDSRHPDIGRCVYYIGCLYMEWGNYGQAEENYNQSLDIYTKIYGASDHPAIAKCCRSLGNLQMERGKYDDAICCYNKSLTMHRRIYGEGDHPEIATCYYILSNLRTKWAQYNQAKIDGIKSLEMFLRIYGDAPHPKVAKCYDNLGHLHMKNHGYDTASDYHQRSLEIHRQIYSDSEHPDIAKCYRNLGHLHKAQDQFDEAKDFHERSLSMCMRVFGDCDHPEIAKCYYMLASLNFSQEHHSKGMIYCIKSLEMYERVYSGSDHPEIAMCYAALGNLHNIYHQFELAEDYHVKCLSVLQNVYLDQTHPDIGECYNNLGRLYYQQQQYGAAKENYEKAPQIFYSIYGRSSNHTDIQLCQDVLENLDLTEDTSATYD